LGYINIADSVGSISTLMYLAPKLPNLVQ